MSSPETNCTSCGDGNTNPNPLDACTRSFLQCDNPCAIAQHNTPQCESLPSRVENFTKNFFGDVVRTEVNGQVVWSLPCGLDVGLPANPRGLDEGLACYFLRLFNDGIVGLTGPQGLPGQNGINGHNAYTVTLSAFSTPAVGSTVMVQTLYNPGILLNSYVFVDTSGWYQVVGKSISGVLTLRLLIAAPGAGFIPSGKLVVPSGQPGTSIPGPKGDKGQTGPQGDRGPQGDMGAKGDTGPAGNSFLANNGYITGFGGSDFTITDTGNTFDTINFGGAGLFQFVAPAQGVYVVMATFDITNVNGGSDIEGGNFKFINLTTSIEAPGGATICSPIARGVSLSCAMTSVLTTTGLNQTIAVQGTNVYDANSIKVFANRSALTYFQIQ